MLLVAMISRVCVCVRARVCMRVCVCVWCACVSVCVCVVTISYLPERSNFNFATDEVFFVQKT